MAITSTTDTNWTNIIGKQNRLDRFLATGKLRVTKISVAVTSSTTYSTNGIVVDLSNSGQLSTVLAAVVLDSQGFVAAYVPDATNTTTGGKLKLFGEEQTTGTPGAVLNELANSSSLVQGKTFVFLVIGY